MQYDNVNALTYMFDLINLCCIGAGHLPCAMPTSQGRKESEDRVGQQGQVQGRRHGFVQKVDAAEQEARPCRRTHGGRPSRRPRQVFTRTLQ
eukprot:scaffold395555_cov29-Prasinocladus_malaysianus.AAC.1